MNCSWLHAVNVLLISINYNIVQCIINICNQCCTCEYITKGYWNSTSNNNRISTRKHVLTTVKCARGITVQYHGTIYIYKQQNTRIIKYGQLPEMIQQCRFIKEKCIQRYCRRNYCMNIRANSRKTDNILSDISFQFHGHPKIAS